MSRILRLHKKFGPVVTGGHLYEDNLYRWLKEDGVDITRQYATSGKSVLPKLFYPFILMRLFRKIKGYDLILFNSTSAPYFLLLHWLIRLAYKKRTIVIHHHFLGSEFKGLKHYFYKALEYSFLKSADFILTPSPYILSLCQKKFGKQKSVCLPIPFSRPSGSQEAEPVKGSLVFIGTIEPRKGLIYLINALRDLKKRGHDYSLTIIGKTKDSTYKESLDKIIEEASLDVSFTGFVSDEEKKRILSGSDVFVFPSLLEGYGMVLCEAMAYGLPVVCFDNSAMPYTVHDNENGILIANKDHRQLADAIKRIVEQRDVREKLSEGALRYADTLPRQEEFRREAKDLFLKLADFRG